MKNNNTLAFIIAGVVLLLLVVGGVALNFAGGSGPKSLPDGTTATNIGTVPPAGGTTDKPTPPPTEPAPTAVAPLTKPGTPPTNGKVMPAPTQADMDAAKKAGTQHAIIKTAKGTIEVDLYGADAPLCVANFVKLVKEKFYDGLTFHRVETAKDFQLIQGGDPNGNGSGGPGYQIRNEISPKLKHVEGALAWARADDVNSAGSQFYICNVAIPSLDGRQYAVFGKVTKGLDVSRKIAVGDKINSITIK
jgi:peptidyl-prolyl cis-trans isomerase B (cyclophilin B)